MTKKKEAEKLLRFIHAVTRNEPPDPEAKVAGLQACQAAIEALYAREGAKTKSFALDSPQFVIAVRYVQKKLRWTDAVEELRTLASTTEKPGSASTARDHLKLMRPKAEAFVKEMEKLDSLLRKTIEYPVLT